MANSDLGIPSPSEPATPTFMHHAQSPNQIIDFNGILFPSQEEHAISVASLAGYFANKTLTATALDDDKGGRLYEHTRRDDWCEKQRTMAQRPSQKAVLCFALGALLASGCSKENQQASATRSVGLKSDTGKLVQLFKEDDLIVLRQCSGKEELAGNALCKPEVGKEDIPLKAEYFREDLWKILNASYYFNFDGSGPESLSRWRSFEGKKILTREEAAELKKTLEIKRQQVADLLKDFPELDSTGSFARRLSQKWEDEEANWKAILDINDVLAKLIDDVVPSDEIVTLDPTIPEKKFYYYLLLPYVRYAIAASEIKFLPVKGGKVKLGGKKGEVQVPDFEVTQTEITQAQYAAIMFENDSVANKQFQCPDSFVQYKIRGTVSLCPKKPVTEVSASSGRWLAQKLTNSNSFNYFMSHRKEGVPADVFFDYSLLTEIEYPLLMSHWLEAEKDPIKMQEWLRLYDHIGEEINYNLALQVPFDVATKEPDPKGFYDLVGNVSEIVDIAFLRQGRSIITTPTPGPRPNSSSPGSAYNFNRLPRILIEGEQYYEFEGHPLNCDWRMTASECQLASAFTWANVYSNSDRLGSSNVGIRIVRHAFKKQ